jgi:ribonuclease P protein component
VRLSGKSYPHPLIVLVIAPNGLTTHNRYAVITGRTIGKAVKRNQVKRQIRAALKDIHPLLTPGWDILVIARRALVGTTFDQIRDALRLTCGRASLIKTNNDNASAT